MYIKQPRYENEMDQENVCIPPSPFAFFRVKYDYKIEYEYFFLFCVCQKIPAPHTLLRLQHYVILSITFLFVTAYVSTESFLCVCYLLIEKVTCILYPTLI